MIRTPESLAALTLFYPSQKILYIEDALGIGIYEDFIRKNFPEYLQKIVLKPAYSKSNVKKVYEILEKKESPIEALYIIDLDYSKFLEEDLIQDKKMLILNRYTLENYMISKQSTEIIFSKKESITLEEASRKFGYDEWIRKMDMSYRRLIPIFLAIQSYEGDKEGNAGASSERFFSKETCEICEDKIKNYTSSVNKILENNSEKYSRYIKKIEEDESIVCAIPGKQLITLLKFELNKKIRNKIIKDDDLRIMLSDNFDVEFKNIIEKLLKDNL